MSGIRRESWSGSCAATPAEARRRRNQPTSPPPADLLDVLVAAERDPHPCGCVLLHALRIGDAARAIGASTADLDAARARVGLSRRGMWPLTAQIHRATDEEPLA